MAAGGNSAPAWNLRSCAKCGERSLSTGAKSLATKDGTPVCLHKICLSCRDKVEARKQGWVFNGDGCTECEVPFAKLVDAALPSGDAAEFFRHVNLSCSGKISPAELSAWTASLFDVSAAEAAEVVEERWDSWDSETRGVFAQWILRQDAKDGALDPDEFPEAQRFLAGMEEAAQRRAAPSTAASPAGGTRRPLNDADVETMPPTKRRRSAQELMAKMQTTGLLSKLREGDGHLWFEYFDRDSSGKLSKEEVINAMVETLKEFNMSQDDARSVVEGIWSIVDHDRSQEIEFGAEFARLREMLLESTRER